LAKAINGWEGGDTALVIALYGEWGSGKSSLINLALNDIDKNIDVIQFNPWVFSETDNLLHCFINELVLGLNVKTGKNKILIKKLEYYSELLAVVSQKKEVKGLFNNISMIFALLGITSSQIIQFFSREPRILSIIVLAFGVLASLVNSALLFFRSFSKYKEKSIDGVKDEIKNY